MSNPVHEAPSGPGRRRELLAIILMASAVLAVVSLYSTATGAVGALLSRWLRAFFGRTALVPALFLFGWGVGFLRKTDRVGTGRRALSLVLLYGALHTGYHLVTVVWNSPATAFWARRLGEEQGGGGLSGGYLTGALLAAFGPWGSAVVLLAAALISITLYLDTSVAALASRAVQTVVRLLRRIGSGLWHFFVGVKEEIVELVAALRDRRQLAASQRAIEAARAQPDLQSGADGAEKSARRSPRAAAGADQKGLPSVAVKTQKQRSKAVATEQKHSEAMVAAAAATDSPSAGPGEKASAQREDEATRPKTRRQLSLADEAPYYVLPDTALLDRPKDTTRNRRRQGGDQSQLLEETLATFGVEAKVVQVSRGPVITRYELQPAPGIKVSRIVNLADDVSLNLAAAGVRIEAPVPGKSVVGIEVPNKETSTVYFREVAESKEFQQHSSKLTAALGKDISGKPVIADLTKLLHLLIAGATGSGKSVCINTLICSLLYKARPDEVKMLMIDPKRVELAVYDGIPHLITPVVTDPKLAANALRWAVKEMESRYKKFSDAGVRNIAGYNKAVKRQTVDGEHMPYIAVIIDELADLMLVSGNDVEDSICRLAQMARAAGIHLVIATQRPSVDVITGLIKANVPSRLSFAVSSGVDSRTILDMMGAERLLGRGDMLFYPIGANQPLRAQGALITDREVQAVVDAWKRQGEPDYADDVTEGAKGSINLDEGDDELFEDAVRLVVETGTASISMIQRRFRVGYARAARLIDMMELAGIVGPYQGSKPRDVLKAMDDLEEAVN